MIGKEKFVEYADVLRRWYAWVNKLDDMGIILHADEPEILANLVYDIILEGDMDFDYDEYAGISWVANWCCSELEQTGFRRVRDWIYIEDAEKLYDFIKEMAERGWPEKVDKEWLI